MVNYSFETRAMNVEEKGILRDNLKSQKFGLAAFFIFVLLIAIVFLYLTDNCDSPFLGDFYNLVRTPLAITPLIIVLSMIYKYWNNEAKKDLELDETSLATAKLKDFLTDEDFNNLHFIYQGKYQTYELTFYFSAETIVKLKALKRPIAFKEISRNQLVKSLKRDQLYTITFALNAEYLFSIEEV
jgi:hypothetical protein